MADGSNLVAGDRIRAFLERVERLEEEKREVADQIKLVFAEAKAEGFCTKTLRKLIALRKRSSDEIAEEAEMLDLYASAVGMDATPLGAWAKAAARDGVSVTLKRGGGDGK